MNRIKWSIVIIMILFCATASAEYYKYRDQNGNIVFTDDITRVPRDQQTAIQKYQEHQADGGETRQQEALKEAVQQPSDEALQAETSQEETPATESPEAEIAEGDLEKEKSKLDKRKLELDEEYQSILKEKETLSQKKVFRNKQAAAAYNSDVAELNQRIDAYEKKKEAFNADTEVYNIRVKKEIEELIEKNKEKK